MNINIYNYSRNPVLLVLKFVQSKNLKIQLGETEDV